MDLVARVEENYSDAINRINDRLAHRGRPVRRGDHVSKLQDRLNPAERMSKMRLKRRDSSNIQKRMEAKAAKRGEASDV